MWVGVLLEKKTFYSPRSQMVRPLHPFVHHYIVLLPKPVFLHVSIIHLALNT